MHLPNAQSIFEKIRIVSKDNIMSTKIHNEMIEEVVGWAKSLGYGVVEYNLGTNTRADVIFENLSLVLETKKSCFVKLMTTTRKTITHRQRCALYLY